MTIYYVKIALQDLKLIDRFKSSIFKDRRVSSIAMFYQSIYQTDGFHRSLCKIAIFYRSIFVADRYFEWAALQDLKLIDRFKSSIFKDRQVSSIAMFYQSIYQTDGFHRSLCKIAIFYRSIFVADRYFEWAVIFVDFLPTICAIEYYLD